MIFRELAKSELKYIWSIERREFVKSIYEMHGDTLKEVELNFQMEGWPPNEDKIYEPILEDCFDRGGYFYGAFDEDKLIGIVVLESKFIGNEKNKLQLKFLHLSEGYRKKGLGKFLFLEAASRAKELGAKKLYISSCENKNTVDFYMNLGCKITEDVDSELFQLEPKDIHMEYLIK